MKYPPKLDRLMQRIFDAVDRGEYVVSNHAYERATDRQVPIPHAEYALRHGFHEKKKDQFKAEYQAWRYAIRGKSPDHVNVRIVVAFADDGLMIVTVINLDRRD